MDKKIRLFVKGISGSVNRPEAYVLILGNQNQQFFPVIINFPEAQSIAFYLEQNVPERPFVHDLFFGLTSEYNIEVLEVFIRDFRNSVFDVEVLCFDGVKHVTLHARIADAVALSLRFGCPIFIVSRVFDMVAVRLPGSHSSLSELTMDELYEMLDKVVHDEDYETAILIRDEIKSRTLKK
jgi:bifunctional DNase/RNase